MATAEDRIDVVACWFADNKAIARAGFTKITRRVLAEFADRRSSPERTADGVAETLTSRERDMLSLLSEGLSNQEIADRLFIEPMPGAAQSTTTSFFADTPFRRRLRAAGMSSSPVPTTSAGGAAW